jgi:hypothetical protein
MDRRTEGKPGATKRRVPMWVGDSPAGLFLLVLWVVLARDTLAEGRELSFPVGLGIPATVLLYGAYRVGRRLIKGSAYPPRKDQR